MKFIDWLKSLRQRRSRKQISPKATRSPRPSWKQPLAIALTAEDLEDRTMLSGVTILTHGAEFNTDNNELEPWLKAMSNSIVDQIEASSEKTGEVAQFLMNITGEDSTPIIDQDNGWCYLPGFTSQAPPSSYDLADSLDGEAVIVLDWSSIAGFDLNGGWETYTQLVAEAVSNFIFEDLSDLGKQILGSPIHLIGHSRGASLVGALAEDFGEIGVLVDQVTFLDPHPVADEGAPENGDWGDAEIIVPQNVVFADNYWRERDFSRTNGDRVTGAFNVKLNNDHFTGDEEGGYGGGLDSSDEHSDVHLWYHGTIDTSENGFNDGEKTVDNVDYWYSPEAFEDIDGGLAVNRNSVGYYFSRIAGGERPEAGLNPALFESEAICDVNETDLVCYERDVWPGIVELKVASDDITIGMGETLDVDFYRRDFDSRSDFTLFLDDDQNPYNNSEGQRQLGEMDSYASTRDHLLHQNYSVVINGIKAGSYYVYGQISDGPRTRYAYAPRKITITENPFAGVDLFGSDAYVPSAPFVPGDLLNYSFTFSNSGSEAANPFAVEWYLSRDSTIDESDRRIGRQNIQGLAAGATTPADYRGLVLPDFSDEIWNGNGTYYIGTIIDPDNANAESNEGNNNNAGLGLDTVSLEITGISAPPADLVVTTLVDENDGNFSADDLSLREAIEIANSRTGIDTITFNTDVTDPEIDLNSTLGELTITEGVIINGLNKNSAGGQVTINGQDAIRVFYINDNSHENTEFWNLNVKGGSTTGSAGSNGGAIHNDDGSLFLYDCFIYGNFAEGDGGAIYNSSESVTMVRTKIRTSDAGGQGGGIYSSSGIVSIIDSIIESNTANEDGGGIYSREGTLTISRSEILENFATDQGGGISSKYDTLSIIDSKIKGNGQDDENNKTGEGGGIYSSNNLASIVNSIIEGNIARERGGGIYHNSNELSIINSSINNNTAIEESGGGIYTVNSITTLKGASIYQNSAIDGGGVEVAGTQNSFSMANSTVFDNTSVRNGGGLELNGPVIIINSTISKNRSDSDGNADGTGGGIYARGSTSLLNTIVAGNMEGAASAPHDIFGTVSGNHNLIGNADSSGGLSHNIDGNIVGDNGSGTIPIETVLNTEPQEYADKLKIHALVRDSPAINAGSNVAAQNASLSTDQRGDRFQRIADGNVDIGAMEIQSLQLVVSTLADESDGDFSPGDFSLREAIEQANANPGVDSISFDIGDTNPEIELRLDLGELKITDDLSIDGINTNATGGRVSIDGQDAVRVIFIESPNETPSIIVDLFNLTIKGGKTIDSNDGAGIYNQRGILFLTNCTVKGNSSPDYGGGGLSSECGSLYISDSLIIDNVSGNDGGGVKATDNVTVITNSILRDNVAGVNGGGIYTANGTLTLRGSTLSSNMAAVEGGGISGTDMISIIDSTISDNIAQSGGGLGLYGAIAPKLILNSTISRNSASINGGGLDVNTDISIINNTITGNRADSDGDENGTGGGIRNNNGVLSLENTIVAGNYQGLGDTQNDIAGVATDGHNLIGDAGSSGGLNDGVDGNVVGDGGIGTLEISNVLNTLLLDNGGTSQTHELVRNSPAIDAGLNSLTVSASLEVDQRGSNRIFDGDHNSISTVDIGSYEYFSIASQYDLRIVKDKTEAQSNGEVNSLPPNRDWIGEWDDYWVEIWLNTPTTSDLGIQSGVFSLDYDTDVTSAVEIEFGPAFTDAQSGDINDATGTIENLSAETTLTDVGDDQSVLFARIHFESTSDDAVDLDFDGHSLNSQSPGLTIQNTAVLLMGNHTSDAVPGLDSDTQIWANPYDYNDDDRISFRDLILFASAYGEIPSQSDSTYAWVADVNQSDRVDFRDLVRFATNYGKSKQAHSTINYPQNYPDSWNQLLIVDAQVEPSLKTQPVTQATAEEMLGSVKEQIRPEILPSERTSIDPVSVQVVDLEGDTLGRAAPGVIYIDINAAGYGWFVDTTPLDNGEFQYDSRLSLIALPGSEAEGLVDLWTVIRHELGHLLGYEHNKEGIMQDSLAPGVRELSSWDLEFENKSTPEDADLFFDTVKDNTDLHPF